ncbi:chromate transporter (plasmid) [Pararobbsia alpina]
MFLKLGLTSFGGPVAHIAYFRREFVKRLQWLDDAAFTDLVGLCQFLPGPASSQVGFSIGLLRASWLGAFAAWIGFTLPSALLLVAFAILAPRLNGAAGTALIHGLKLVAVAVVAQAVWDMARRLCPDRPRALIALIALAMSAVLTATSAQILVILCGGLLGTVVCRSVESTAKIGTPPESFGFRVSRRIGAVALLLFCVLLFAVPALARSDPSPVLTLFDAFFRSGALVFGGGHVMLPLLQQRTVATGWVAPNDFLAGYGAAQAIPGPLSTFAAFLGWVAIGVPSHAFGATIATIAIFLPGFLLVIGAMPYWQELRAHPSMAAALAGVNAAVVGLLATALYSPVWTSAIHSSADFAVAGIAFVLLIRWKAPPLAIVGFCALAGLGEMFFH